jgi:hypothetical protein
LTSTFAVAGETETVRDGPAIESCRVLVRVGSVVEVAVIITFVLVGIASGAVKFV